MQHGGEGWEREMEGQGSEGEGRREGGLEGGRKRVRKGEREAGEREGGSGGGRKRGNEKGGKEGKNGKMDTKYFPDLDTWGQGAGT